ncbi:YadA-like family protein [Ralstonia insidiosa]|uniref:Uncharacterized protein n=1 Tax=Ralstonia insidiosa TaxID=190721 RepID=A0A192A4J1_9RALS|nr:ESPR-type extended signal peptide-containing protein [Ralstonia insidiosa]ANJ75304.1 hypothetical protein A9Y76_22590 [Ralstonia insidiosa]KAB0467962.1 transporter [Ralstonia insidiosa]MBY4910638.1 YadA-like family protein [Ralstonia insidiosa]
MNKIYRSVWNTTTNTWTAAAETAKSHSKGSARAARSVLAALVQGGAAMGGASAAEVCTTEDGKRGALDATGACRVTTSSSEAIGTMGSIGATATLDDAYIKVGNGNGAWGNAAISGNAANIAIGAGSQSSGTNSVAASVAVGALSKATGDSSTALGSDTTASGLTSTAVGSNTSATHSNSVALGYQSATDRADSVSVGSTSKQRQITNMAAGTQANDAVNVSQLKSSVEALGGGATINPDGTIKAPSYTLANGGTQTTVGGALGALDGAITTTNNNVAANKTSIENIRTDLSSGTLGLVRQAAAGADLTVGEDIDGAAVNFAGKAGNRTLTGVANGAVSATSADAVNGSQLHGVSTSVASAIGAGSTVNADGSITAPSFTVGDGKGGTTTVNNVGAVVSNLDGRTTKNESDIGSIRDDMNSGSIGLVKQATPTSNITVAADSGGSVVNFANNTGGNRVLSGVAAGIGNNDAVSVGQLKSVIGYNIVDPLDPLMAVRYDDASMKSVTFGTDSMGIFLNNVRGGDISAGSLQAVNGGQLYAMQQDFNSRFGKLDDRVKDIESGSGVGPGLPPGGGAEEGSGGPGSIVVGDGADASGKNSSAIGSGAVASGENASAIGNGAVASGKDSTAIGQGAQATHESSMALGTGSQTSRENEVSIGAPGAERYLGNVKDGELDHDAVNVRQLRGVQNQVDTNRRDAMGGTAAAMAVAGLPQSSMPGKTFMAISGSTYGGEQGTAVGVSYMSKDGRWLVKSAVNTSTRGEVGAVVGGGFYW